MERRRAEDEALSADAEWVVSAARAASRSIAVAESLTGGLLASSLARAEGASEWFRGGIVACHPAVKHGLLAVPPGPVVSRASAEAMATNVARLLRASLGLAVTGVGGPDSQDDEPPGTVWLGVHLDGFTETSKHHFQGDPEQVCYATCSVALDMMLYRLAQVHRRSQLDAFEPNNPAETHNQRVRESACHVFNTSRTTSATTTNRPIMMLPTTES